MKKKTITKTINKINKNSISSSVILCCYHVCVSGNIRKLYTRDNRLDWNKTQIWGNIEERKRSKVRAKPKLSKTKNKNQKPTTTTTTK